MADVQIGCDDDAVIGTQKVDPEGRHQGFKRPHSSNPCPGAPSKSPRHQSPSHITHLSATENMDENKGEEMNVVNYKEDVQTEGPSLSSSNRRKSWRRSTRSRRSLPAVPNPFQILCRSISPSQPPEERLVKLMEASMRLAIDRTQDSLQSTPNSSMESFQKQVETVQKEWCSVAKYIHSEARCLQPLTRIDGDPEMQRAKEQTWKAIHRLQAESESWEALLNKHRSKAEELARRVEQGGGVQLDPTCVVQSSQSQLIQGKPDYNSLLHRQLPVLQTMAIVMDTQCKMIRELLSIQEHSQLLVKETSVKLAADAGFQDLPSDPVRNLLAGPLSTMTSLM